MEKTAKKEIARKVYEAITYTGILRACATIVFILN